MRRISLTSGLCVALLLLTACKDEQTKVAEAAAKSIASARMLGPDDLQVLSMDRTVGLEVVGDSVHVFLPNSVIHVPATHIQNVKYADNRLRFDIEGIGMKVFEVGDGREGAVFNQADALRFVTVVLRRQMEMETR
ncbi:hypothetical protein [Gemmatimonas aurantiaca]|uniref:hypothetical protein n=1 Tax=Gemmatimonas aurantiaca TaxID=173480 RepID=UPI00301C90CE